MIQWKGHVSDDLNLGWLIHYVSGHRMPKPCKAMGNLKSDTPLIHHMILWIVYNYEFVYPSRLHLSMLGFVVFFVLLYGLGIYHGMKITMKRTTIWENMFGPFFQASNNQSNPSSHKCFFARIFQFEGQVTTWKQVIYTPYASLQVFPAIPKAII